MSSSELAGPSLPLGFSGPPGKQNCSDAATPSATPSSPNEGAVVCPGDMVLPGFVPASLDPYDPLCESTTSQPFPLPSTKPLALPTPLRETQPDLGLEFAGSVLPPIEASLPTPLIVRNAPNLRLPSFDVLGIAAAHPDRFGLHNTTSFSPLGAGPLSKPEDPLHALSPPMAQSHRFPGTGELPATSPEVSRHKFDYLIPIVTPPSEPGTFNWGTFVHIGAASLGSPPSSEPGVSPNVQTTAGAFPSQPAFMQDPLSVTELSDALGTAVWVEKVKERMISELPTHSSDSVKVLSHALPTPSITGHLFTQIIAAIHERTSTPTSWINVFHAVPGRFTLSDLPKSPPSTPGPAVGGDEYFTSKVFDSAVTVDDYQLDSKLLPPSPRPVVPPGSVNISVVERYIPPTNINEFAEMFQFKGRSLLYDRLVELSSDNGLLLFIYPTRAGAKTFMREYLGPILDPLLRSMAVVHDLSSDLGKSIGHMSAVEHLHEYSHLHIAVERFCGRLSELSSPLTPSANEQATYSILHATKEEIVLDRTAWASDWWIKQEKTRVRDTVNKQFRKKMPKSDMTPTNLIQEILDGVAQKEHHPFRPLRGVEVGVFIIKKTV